MFPPLHTYISKCNNNNNLKKRKTESDQGYPPLSHKHTSTLMHMCMHPHTYSRACVRTHTHLPPPKNEGKNKTRTKRLAEQPLQNLVGSQQRNCQTSRVEPGKVGGGLASLWLWCGVRERGRHWTLWGEGGCSEAPEKD